jgi:hypothetical protein
MKDVTKATATFRGLVDGFCEAVLAHVGNEWTPYSLSSLTELEAVLQSHKDHGTSFSEIPHFFTGLGIYLGEVIRRQLGQRCWWTMEDRQPILTIDGPKVTLKLKPVVRIAKRLSNPAFGIEDFATYGIAIGQGTTSDCSYVHEEACADS